MVWLFGGLVESHIVGGEVGASDDESCVLKYSYWCSKKVNPWPNEGRCARAVYSNELCTK